MLQNKIKRVQRHDTSLRYIANGVLVVFRALLNHQGGKSFSKTVKTGLDILTWQEYMII